MFVKLSTRGAEEMIIVCKLIEEYCPKDKDELNDGEYDESYLPSESFLQGQKHNTHNKNEPAITRQ
jgi:hypothetical protein